MTLTLISISGRKFPGFAVSFYLFSLLPSNSIHHLLRRLGDHTKKIVEYAESCVADNKQVTVNSDGPYGTLPFNYLRYRSVLASLLSLPS